MTATTSAARPPGQPQPNPAPTRALLRLFKLLIAVAEQEVNDA